MPSTSRTTRTAILLVIAIAILATLAKAAEDPRISKSAAFLCFALLAVLLFILPTKRSVGPVDNIDGGDEDSGRQSLTARLGWAVWMSLSATACFGGAQLAGTMLPPLALPLRAVGVVLLIVAAYKLFFGRRGKNIDLDL
jgi:hypothetical protein